MPHSPPPPPRVPYGAFWTDASRDNEAFISGPAIPAGEFCNIG